MKKFLAVLAVLAVAVTVQAGGVWKALPLEARASLGATHVIEFEAADLTLATTNTAQTFTNAIPAKSAVEFVGLVLDTAFSVGNTNATDSCLMKIGDGSDDDLFMASTELASDGTEVFVKYGPPNAATVAVTRQGLTYTNVIYDAGATTGNVYVVTNATAAATAAELGRKLYAAAGSIITTFTPDSGQALDNFATGTVRVYFKLFNTKDY